MNNQRREKKKIRRGRNAERQKIYDKLDKKRKRRKANLK